MKAIWKAKSGLTFIATIFLVIVIAVLVFGVVYFVRIQYAKESLEDLKTDMLLVQAKVKTISSEYILEEKEDVLQGTKISEMKENEAIQDFLAKDLFDAEEKNKKYYVWDQTTLQEQDLTQVNLEEGTYYIVEYTDNEVYYTQGFTYADGTTYYEISDIEKLEAEE